MDMHSWVLVAAMAVTLAVFPVGASPTVTLTGAASLASSYLVPSGTTITLNCNTSSLNAGGSYTWSRSFGDTSCGALIVGLITFNLSTPLTNANVTCYQCTYSYTDAGGASQASTSDSLLLYPYQLPDVTSFAFDLATVSNINATCSFKALSPCVSPTFVWTRASTGYAVLNGTFSTANDSTLVIGNSTSAGDLYYCHGIMANSSITGNPTNGVYGVLLATYSVYAPPSVAVQPFARNVNYVQGASVTVTCTALGYPSPNVILLKNSTVVNPTSLQVVKVTGGIAVSLPLSLNPNTDFASYLCIGVGETNSSFSYSHDVQLLSSTNSAVGRRGFGVARAACAATSILLSCLLVPMRLIL